MKSKRYLFGCEDPLAVWRKTFSKRNHSRFHVVDDEMAIIGISHFVRVVDWLFFRERRGRGGAHCPKIVWKEGSHNYFQRLTALFLHLAEFWIFEFAPGCRHVHQKLMHNSDKNRNELVVCVHSAFTHTRPTTDRANNNTNGKKSVGLESVIVLRYDWFVIWIPVCNSHK